MSGVSLTHEEFVRRFWSRVDKSGDCWLWTGSRSTSSGYGGVKRAGRQVLVHRVAYELANGPPPVGMYVCHHCDTPLCCNPAHLYAGTPKQNSADREQRRRRKCLQGPEQPLSKLTADQAREVRRLHDRGLSYPTLARMFGMSAFAIGRVCRREGYANVD